MKRGFTEKQANTILNFKRSLGGSFKDAKTLKRCYEIPFGAISRIVEGTLEACGAMPADTLEDIFHADLEARRVAKEIAEKLK